MPGHLFAAGPDGVWESQDGGIRWQAVSRVLANPDVLSITHGTQNIYLGGPGGVFVLRRTTGELNEVDLKERREAYAKVPKMGELGDVALRRHGLAITNVLSRRRIVASMLMPKLTVTTKWVR